MKRRNFILLSAAGVAAVGASYWYLNYYSQEHNSSIIEPESLSYIWDRETIITMGANYRKQIPMEDNETSLVKLLSTDINEDSGAIEALKKEIKNDFEKGNTIMIGGWILSVTEARQCALFSIIQPN
jgi:hypothetical protein